MKLIRSEKINKEIKEDWFYSFDTNEGIYLIGIIAQAKSWWQNFKSLRSLFKDDDVTLYLDNTEIFISHSKDSDVRAIWNGNELKGLSKTALVAIFLKSGGHTLRFQPDQSPTLESIKITQLEETDNNMIVYSPLENNPPAKGDRRPWISYVLQNLSVKEIKISASANKNGSDDEDIKLIIDGKVETNAADKNAHQDWFWCGKILKGGVATFQRPVNLEPGKHFIELLSDGSPRLNKIEVAVLPASDNDYTEVPIKPYVYKGVLGNEDYNRYDSTIVEAVAYWNGEFLKDTNPPSEPLDPNLVKAVIYQESRAGYYKGEKINIMQVGNAGDPSIKTLRGEFKEYWIHNGEKILLKYDATVASAKDSAYWGVRWLYHKAQGITYENKRYWKTWKEAVVGFGPPKAEYATSVWDIYKKGIKKEKNGTSHLWVIALLVLAPFLFFDTSAASSLKEQIISEVSKNAPQHLENVEIKYNLVDKNYFLAQIEWEKDWWEDLKVGRIKNRSISWFAINKPPGEQAILVAKFIYAKGFSNPLVEVFGLTHPGHGFLYIYEIKNNVLNLLFKTEDIAVDGNPDTKWAPENYKKYGYGYCGEKFLGDKLASEYRDLNKDGLADLVLSGTQEIICDSEFDPLRSQHQIKAASVQIERKFLWSSDKHTWVEA
ncbi:MAG: hypothetical protein Q7R92_01855 [bacterium]|nr:hypothetical protein [bacterium]